MSRSAVKWVRRGALAVVILLVLGFGVGTLANRRIADKAMSTAPKIANDALYRSTAQKAELAPGAPVPAPAAGAGAASNAAATGAGGSRGALGSLALPPLSDQVIKTADIGIDVAKDRIDRSWDRVFEIAARLGGFVVSSSQGGPTPAASDPADEQRSAEIVIRVPANRFDQALNALSAADVGEVTRRATTGQDVTQEFVDLESRLKHFRAQEAVLLRIMSRARTIGDTISVQQQLSQVQLQIEEITGRLRYLKDQTAFATISVHLAEDGAAVAGASDGPSFSKSWDTAIDGLERMGTAALIGGVWLAPFALLAAAWLATRRWRTRPATEM